MSYTCFLLRSPPAEPNNQLGCCVISHPRCLNQICLVCPSAFQADQVRAAFVRCFASLLYTYRRFLGAPNSGQKKSGMLYSFNMDGFLRSMPSENQEYFAMLRETQGKLRRLDFGNGLLT